MIKSLVFTGVMCSAIGLAVGAILASGAPATSSVQVERTVQQVQGDRGVGRDELASIVRQELARERARAPVAAPPETVDDARARMTDEEQDHAASATHVLRAAIARGRWTLDDRSALSAQIVKLPAAVQAEIGGQLAVALNKGELVMEGDWLPL